MSMTTTCIFTERAERLHSVDAAWAKPYQPSRNGGLEEGFGI